MDRNTLLIISAGLIAVFLYMRNTANSGNNGMNAQAEQPSSPDLKTPETVSDPRRYNRQPILVSDPIVNTNPRAPRVASGSGGGYTGMKLVEFNGQNVEMR